MTVREARQRLDETRARHGTGSGHGLRAFHDLCQAYAAEGRRIDDLDQRSPIEEDRFFASTIQGPDGHVCWQGWRYFTRNDGALRRPARYWWELKHGPIHQQLSVKPTCGEPNCINPEHTTVEDRSKRNRLYTDEQMLGKLQVIAGRLGHTPTSTEWEDLKLTPSGASYANRFGGWPHAVAAAGLEPSPLRRKRATADDALAALHAARRFLGRWPFASDFEIYKPLREHLKAKGLPTSNTTVFKYLGPTWADALRKAGKK